MVKRSESVGCWTERTWRLANTINELFGANNLLEDGIFENATIEIIAVPTIIIDKPITLVGMGDTISSISLVGAR